MPEDRGALPMSQEMSQEYDLGEAGFVKLMPNGTAHFLLGDADPLDHGTAITSEHLPHLAEGD